MFFYVFIICQVLVLRAIVCEYSNNINLRLYQQSGPGDLADGELAQQSPACVNVVFITWENFFNPLYTSQKPRMYKSTRIVLPFVLPTKICTYTYLKCLSNSILKLSKFEQDCWIPFLSIQLLFWHKNPQQFYFI